MPRRPSRRMADPASQSPPIPPEPARAEFSPGEAATVLGRYALGALRSVRPLALGSSRSPKALVTASTGEYLLKRRAPGKDDPARVAFSHGLQIHLARAGFPVPALIPAGPGRDSTVRLGGHTYELFRFARGGRYDGSEAQAAEAGATLARLHALGAGFTPPWPLPPGSYHNTPAIAGLLRAVPARLGERSREAASALVTIYAHNASAVERLGFARWPGQPIHGDWHPGNLLFERGRIVAVFDFDAARVAPRAIDIANGALQFSMTLRPTSPADWPTGLDLGRLRAFLGGYDNVEGAIISRTELEAIAPLMIEALIAEAAPPIAATGRFANLDGHEFLLMMERQSRWIESHGMEIGALLG